MIPRLSQKETKIHENELLRTYYIRIWIYLQDVPNAITHKYYIYIHKIKNAYDFYKNSYFLFNSLRCVKTNFLCMPTYIL